MEAPSTGPKDPRQLPFALASVTILSVAATLAVDSHRELEIQNGRLAAPVPPGASSP